MINARQSFNRLIEEVADPGVSILYEGSQPWEDPCYRVEWLSVEVPIGANRYGRNVRIHFRSKSEGTDGIERRIKRLEDALGLPKNDGAICIAKEYDYFSDMENPAVIGSIEIRRSGNGVTIIPPSREDPDLRHYVLSLVVVYRKR